jgi:hypothetical protein
LLAALAQILLGPDLALGNGIRRLGRQHKEGSSLSDELKPHPRLAVVVVVKRAYLEVRRVVNQGDMDVLAVVVQINRLSCAMLWRRQQQR